MRLGLILMLVALAMFFHDCRLYRGGGGASSNDRSSSSSSLEMYAASRAGISLSCSSSSGVTLFQAGAADGLPTGSLVRAGAGTAVGATVDCSVDSLIGAGTLGYGCGGVALSDVRSVCSC